MTQPTSGIRDNHTRGSVAEFLGEKIQPNSRLAIVSAYFTIYAYEALKVELGQIKHLDFLFGPVDSGKSSRPFQSQIKWLHGKLYHINSAGVEEAILCSSNFTVRGIGSGTEGNNIELNLVVDSKRDRNELKSWFDEIWNDNELVKDVNVGVLSYLPDELHEAVLGVFDLVSRAKLPAIDSIPETQRLPRLRELFETLYHQNHPIRGALAKLQTLDTVRIIEGGDKRP